MGLQPYEEGKRRSRPLGPEILNLYGRPPLRLKPPRLHPVSANPHVAPAPRVILARIQKQPAAFRVVASPYLLHIFREHQSRSRTSQQPQQKLRLRLRARCPLPSQPRTISNELCLVPCLLKKTLQRPDRSTRRIHSVQSRVEKIRQRLPQLSHFCNHPVSCRSARPPPQNLCLFRVQEARLLRKICNIVIALDQLFGPAVTKSPVECIHQLQRRIACTQLEFTFFIP